MKRKIFAGIFILIIILCGFLFFRYIFLYNKANNLYERMDYAGAIEYYEDALAAHPPHFLSTKECNVRINLALAMIYNLGPDFAEPENVENSINTLLAAKEVLLDDNCAAEEEVGHNETAQQLKEEIDKLLEQLQQQNQPQQQPDNQEQEGGGQQQDNQIDEETEQGIQDELQQNQSTAYEERQEGMDFAEEFDSDYNFDFEGEIW